MANPSQLYLLADHIKLSLLERQRAISLDLEPTTQDGHISRSLDSMREGIEALEQEETRLQGNVSLLSAVLAKSRLSLVAMRPRPSKTKPPASDPNTMI